MPLKFSTFMALAYGLAFGACAHAATTVFFDPSQTATNGASGATYDTIVSSGYEFRRTADKFWASTPGGEPTGRFFTVTWPEGVQAQAVTAGPSPSSAQITLSRVDRELFDVSSLTFRLLANTYGAGGSLEIMPMLNGEDGFANPLMLDATGFGGQTFSYQTPSLTAFDTYKMSLYVDFAVTGITLVDSVPEPSTLGGIGIASLLLARRHRRAVER